MGDEEQRLKLVGGAPERHKARPRILERLSIAASRAPNSLRE